jgi:cytosine/adenosine deaminase-related metal-dependent hydrolase
MNFILKNISWRNEDEQITGDVRVKDGIISETGKDLSSVSKEISLDFRNHFLYPGLINSHDHLEMNLYPLMGTPPYHNYTEWAKDIYKPKEPPIKEIECVGIEDRLLWGGIKNLISGVTTVVHHNPWHRALSKKNFPVRVLETAWAHSLAFEKNVEKKFPRKKSPFVIHAAEGTDEFAQNEIAKLHEIGLLKENTVLIHAVGQNAGNVKLMEQTGASIVWCPSSNLFMFGKALPLIEVIHKVKVALGSDSTMTGPATLLDEMRAAESLMPVTAKEIYAMVTEVPAKIFQLKTPRIQIGRPADVWIAPANSGDYFENLLKANPSAIAGVFVGGEMRFGDSGLAASLQAKGFPIEVQNKLKWIAYDVRTLKKRIDSKTKGACAENSLWKILS